jgi:hypothetical protein
MSLLVDKSFSSLIDRINNSVIEERRLAKEREDVERKDTAKVAEKIEQEWQFFCEETNNKYVEELVKSILNKHLQGKRELHMNFNSRHFKRPGLRPASVLCKWLKTLRDETDFFKELLKKLVSSEYKEESNTSTDIEINTTPSVIHFDVWNNDKFTVHFTW